VADFSGGSMKKFEGDSSMSKNRIKMVCIIEQHKNNVGHSTRRVTRDDKERIAKAMLDAYMGTVDQQEDTFEEALCEVENIFNDKYGPLITEASLMIDRGSEVASIILITLYIETPLIIEIFTSKNYYKQGMATSLINASMNQLLDMGYNQLCLYVKGENKDAIQLYRKLGFEIVE
jgi:predicted GNAT family acetyltransferase